MYLAVTSLLGDKLLPSDTASRSVTPAELALLTARPETRTLFICIVMAVTGLVQGFVNGWSTSALTLIGGAVAAIVGMMVLGRVAMRSERPKGGALKGVVGIVPYAFGCYLIFYRGVWGGRLLLESFTIGRLAATIAFVYLGYRLVYWTWQLSEIAEARRSGRLVLAEAQATI